MPYAYATYAYVHDLLRTPHMHCMKIIAGTFCIDGSIKNLKKTLRLPGAAKKSLLNGKTDQFRIFLFYYY